MCSTGFLPDPTNQGKDNQGRVEDEEKDAQKRVHQPRLAMQLPSMLNLQGVKRQSKSPSILAGVGWNGVEWVWRGYNFGYKMPILALSGETGFP